MKTIPQEKVDNRIFMQNSMWADPLEDSFKDGLKKMFVDRQKYRQKCKKARATVIGKFSESKLEKLYDQFFEEFV